MIHWWKKYNESFLTQNKRKNKNERLCKLIKNPVKVRGTSTIKDKIYIYLKLNLKSHIDDKVRQEKHKFNKNVIIFLW